MLRWDLERSGAEGQEMRNAKGLEGPECICGDLKVGKVGLAGSLVHAGNWGAFSAGF